MKFKHKGLRKLFEDNDTSLVGAEMVGRLKDIMLVLDGADSLSSIDSRPSHRLHPLNGDRKGQLAIKVSGNWRIVFRFADGEAVDIDLVDYH